MNKVTLASPKSSIFPLKHVPKCLIPLIQRVRNGKHGHPSIMSKIHTQNMVTTVTVLLFWFVLFFFKSCVWLLERTDTGNSSHRSMWHKNATFASCCIVFLPDRVCADVTFSNRNFNLVRLKYSTPLVQMEMFGKSRIYIYSRNSKTRNRTLSFSLYLDCLCWKWCPLILCPISIIRK